MRSFISGLMSGGDSPSQHSRDFIAVSAMALVTLAAAIALHLHLGLSTSRAAIAGVLIFGLFVATHFIVLPREKPDAKAALEDEELWRALREQREKAPDANRMAMATRTEPDAVEEAQHQDISHLERAQSGDDHPALTLPKAAQESAFVRVESQQKARRKPRILKKVAAPGAVTDAPVDFAAPSASQAHLGEDRVHPESLALRPSVSEELPSQFGAPVGTAEQDAGDVAQPISGEDADVGPETADAKTHGQPSESDVEMVGSLIRELAQQVNATEVLAKSHNETRVEAASPADPDAPPPLPEVPSQDTEADMRAQHGAADTATATAASVDAPVPPPAPTEDLVAQSISALRSTAGTMREAEASRPDHAPQIEQPLQPVASSDAKHHAAGISDALAAGQFGIYLDSILTLDGLTADHFDIQLRVHHPAFDAVPSGDLESALAGTDVLAKLDQIRFEKTVQVANLLRTRGRDGLIFVPIYRDALSDRHFCYTVASNAVANEALSQQLVLTLKEETVLALTDTEWQTLSEFGELGYRFALSGLPDVELDFAQLAAAGFFFIKMSSASFIAQADPSNSSQLVPETRDAGISLVVDSIQDAKVAATCQALGAKLGAGPLTGGPRLMKAEAIQEGNTAVA